MFDEEEKSTMKNGVSVIIPTHNRSHLIARAIGSALAAMSAGDELLVVDDGSTDDTPAVVRAFGDSVRYLRIDNSGPTAARNAGIRAARYPLVAMLDDDNEWLPDKLELQRKVMGAFPEAVFCFCNLLGKRSNGHIDHDLLSYWRDDARVGSVDAPRNLGEVLGPAVPFSSIASLPKGRADFNIHVGDMYPILMEVFYADNNAVMVRKELGGASYRYDEDLRNMDDTECFARLSKLGPAAYLDCELVEYFVHEGPRLTDATEVFHLTTRITLLQRIWGADERFLEAHSARYQSVLREKYLRRAKYLMADGQTKEAKEDLKVVDGPLSYMLLASLPSGPLKNILGVRRKVRKLLKL
jgi:glycosyltransferase involved in cell wall biosynthesis